MQRRSLGIYNWYLILDSILASNTVDGLLINCKNSLSQVFFEVLDLTHRGPVDLRKWAIFNTILISPKSWLSQEDLDASCEHSLVPVHS